MLAPELRAWLAPMLADHVDEAICVYEADDRVIAWNAAYPVLFPEVRDMLRPGLPFLDTVRALFELQHPVDAETMEPIARCRRRTASHRDRPAGLSAR